MTAYLLVGHLLNLLAPAALIALLLVVFALMFPRFFKSNKAIAHSWWAQAAINFVVGSTVLVTGLVWLGNDGKMLTYMLLVLAVAVSQWCQMSGWKR